MALSLLPLVWIGPTGAFPLLAAVLIVHAFAAATQDVAIDALAIRASAESERGALNGWMQAGMLTGRSAFGGGALVVRERLGDDVVILALVAALLGGALFTLLAPLPREGEGRAARPGELSTLLRRALRKRATWAGLGFAVLAGAGFEGLGAFVGPFLKDRGWSDAAVGTFVGLPAVGAMLLGGLVGGACADRIGHRRTVASSVLFVACGVWALAASGDATAATLACLLVVDLGLGALVASSYALFMDLTDPALGGTQFSAFMGATNLCEAWSVAAAGRLSTRLGYAPAFSILAAVSLAALPLLKSGATDARDGIPRDHEEP
jgi:predicted MFS family arabinose efflux permease